MRDAPADGTRAHLPDDATARADLTVRLQALYAAWGYARVEVPALERYDPRHPRAAQSFKLSDRDSGVLALRSDFTPALARLVRQFWPHQADPRAASGTPLRLQYGGSVWHAIDPELARTREFTQLGLELIGVAHPRADAELVHLARESVRAVGLKPRVEIGSPGLVNALLDEAGVPPQARAALGEAIDRKDPHDVERLVAEHAPHTEAGEALRCVPDLYGHVGVLRDARALPLGEASRAALTHLEGVLAEFEDDSELLVDLGMARRLSYYTGVTFRAYTVDVGQPLLGGGRYDGALLPYAAGFSIGLERLQAALPSPAPLPRPRVLAMDDGAARLLRAAGVATVRSVAPDADGAAAEARALGVPWLLTPAGLRSVVEDADPAERARLEGLLEGDGA